jgi:predicted O-linked N-acetylglucosamine transferase (SPINDLY family)
LCLKAPQLADQATAQRVLDFLNARGVPPEHVRLEGRLPWDEHYALYEEIDIALDPFPYNGTTTTCEALWMGVPVLTLAGALHAGRVGVSLLAQVGRSELVAGSVQEYVELAKGLAADGARREGYRRDLRAAVQNSPLGDGPAFAQKFETMLMSLPA